MVQTRSALNRIKSGKVDNNDKAVPPDNTVGLPPDDSDDVPPPAKKRRRGGARALKKSRQAKPGYMIQLNLDVLYLICESVHPLDLLNLTRTCKPFRGLLMSKSSGFIWKAARRQVKGLPDCPGDLSEPAYANLAFYAHCHVCDKRTTSIFWYIRRRYCLDCRVERLCDGSYCPEVISPAMAHICERTVVQKEHSRWYDRELVDLVMQEYERSSNKEQFLSDKEDQHLNIHMHASDCEYWQRKMASERRQEQKALQRERDRSILERLKQLGYEREINHFGCGRFQESRGKSPKPLTDREWARILPKWLETMNRYRVRRLDAVVWQARRRSLKSEYDTYVRKPSSNTPTFDLLPHVIDLARFPPFRDIIEAPEEAQMNEKPFASAFAQLHMLVDEWRKPLDVELTELVKIPPHLSLEDASRDLGVASNSASHAEVFQAGSDKLHLACALFRMAGTGVFTHSEVFSTCLLGYPYPKRNANASNRTGSIEERFDIHFLEEAPYIVHACGLDPNVATVDDMDHRNARLMCLACKPPNNIVMNWRDAMLHAQTDHHRRIDQRGRRVPISPHWQLINDEYICMIQAVEVSTNCEAARFCFERCLLCLPRVGDAGSHNTTIRHLRSCHEVKEEDARPGVHYARLGINDGYSSKVEMVEEGGQVRFRKPQSL